MTFERLIADPEAMERLGREIAASLRPGLAVCLTGPLGAGKTTLARALIRALTTPQEEVPSPTFTLAQHYDGRAFPLVHFDLYRLKSASEAQELGLEDALDDGAAVIEWSERLGARLPPDRLDVEIQFRDGDEARWVRASAVGAWKE
jgi:tRNA threonylcarbamoyladenosine biosynthesis protein TsaE